MRFASSVSSLSIVNVQSSPAWNPADVAMHRPLNRRCGSTSKFRSYEEAREQRQYIIINVQSSINARSARLQRSTFDMTDDWWRPAFIILIIWLQSKRYWFVFDRLPDLPVHMIPHQIHRETYCNTHYSRDQVRKLILICGSRNKHIGKEHVLGLVE